MADPYGDMIRGLLLARMDRPAKERARSGLFANLPKDSEMALEELPPRSTDPYGEDPFGDDPFAPQPEGAAQRYIDTLPADDPIFRRRRPEPDPY